MSWTRIWKKNKRIYGWRHVQQACDQLVKQYKHPVPDRIIALARGGLIPATILANKLGVRHVYSMGLSSYEPDDTGEEHPNEFDIYQRLPVNLPQLDLNQHVLIVDDISDRGNTFEYAESFIKNNIGGTVITMSLVIKPRTKFTPNYYHDLVPDDCWVVFPWERS